MDGVMKGLKQIKHDFFGKIGLRKLTPDEIRAQIQKNEELMRNNAVIEARRVQALHDLEDLGVGVIAQKRGEPPYLIPENRAWWVAHTRDAGRSETQLFDKLMENVNNRERWREAQESRLRAANRQRQLELQRLAVKKSLQVNDDAPSWEPPSSGSDSWEPPSNSDSDENKSNASGDNPDDPNDNPNDPSSGDDPNDNPNDLDDDNDSGYHGGKSDNGSDTDGGDGDHGYHPHEGRYTHHHNHKHARRKHYARRKHHHKHH